LQNEDKEKKEYKRSIEELNLSNKELKKETYDNMDTIQKLKTEAER